MTDLSDSLASVGGHDTTFPMPHGHGDKLHLGNAGLDPRSLTPKGLEARGGPIPDLHIDTIKVKTRDFR